MAPGDRVGVMAFTNGASGAMIWLLAEVAELLRQLLGVPDEVIRTDVPHHPEIWGELCGWYPVSAQLTDTQARGFAGLGAEVFVRRGQLTLRALSPVPAVYRGFPLHPDDDQDPRVFRIDLSQFGLGTARIVFSREPGAGTTRIHTDMVPLSLRKQPASQNPRPWITGGPGALAVVTAAAAVRRRRATACRHG
ncbi:MAG TPA: hypothetical protein VIJ82_24815 [Streptosporangiaceae bacterium]